MTPIGRKQLEKLKNFKKDYTGKADFFFEWDLPYFQKLATDQEYKTDAEFVREFFPAVRTLEEVLDFYAGFFSIKFVKIEGEDADALSSTGKGGDLVWHPDVDLHAAWETKGDGFIGYLYLDIYYREGKTPSAFMMPIEAGFQTKDGKRHYPTAGLVTNSKKATKDSEKPSLLYRGEVEDLFHEMGPCMHQLLSRTQYATYHGPIGVPVDFVELPSQMMENWARIPAVLRKFSQHYTYLKPKYADAWKRAHKGKPQPPRTLPDAQINAIGRAKNAYSALGNLGQVALSRYDQAVHTPASHEAAKAIDVTKLYLTIGKNATQVNGPEDIGEDPGHPESTFSHIMGLYSAAYYGYLWSQVYAEDAFYTAFKKDPFSSETGMRWRKTVLQPGGTKDTFMILTEFLGREPNDEAFYRDLGIVT